MRMSRLLIRPRYFIHTQVFERIFPAQIHWQFKVSNYLMLSSFKTVISFPSDVFCLRGNIRPCVASCMHEIKPGHLEGCIWPPATAKSHGNRFYVSHDTLLMCEKFCCENFYSQRRTNGHATRIAYRCAVCCADGIFILIWFPFRELELEFCVLSFHLIYVYVFVSSSSLGHVAYS